MQRIALVDDDRNILTSVSILLESEGYEVETFTDPELALKEFNRRPPDMAVLDVKMPRMDGFELLKRIRSRSGMPVMMLSSRADEMDKVMGFRLGADDYMTKPFSPRLLVERLRVCSRRGARVVDDENGSVETEELTRGPLTLDEARHMVTWYGEPVRLTRNEFMILKFLAERPEYVRNRQQILDVLYGDGFHVEDRMIDTHIKRLRTKFKSVDPDFKAIDTVYGIGYRYIEPAKN